MAESRATPGGANRRARVPGRAVREQLRNGDAEVYVVVIVTIVTVAIRLVSAFFDRSRASA
jgi:uncharacterized membrane protein